MLGEHGQVRLGPLGRLCEKIFAVAMVCTTDDREALLSALLICMHATFSCVIRFGCTLSESVHDRFLQGMLCRQHKTLICMSAGPTSHC